MGLFVQNKRSKPRRFDYEPRYYNPEKDQKLKHRMRVKSRAQRRRGPAGVVYIAMLLCLALYIYSKIG
jgi:hypothetical protein